MSKIQSFVMLVLVLSVGSAWGDPFRDDFNRPNGDPGNGWATQVDGTITVEIVDNEILIAGVQGVDWIRSGLSRDIVNETRVSLEFKADDGLNFHVRIDDADTSAYFEPYWTPNGSCQYANSEDGGWPGWTALANSAVIPGEYNSLIIEQEGTDLILTLNGTVIGTFPNNNLTNFGNILIASDSAAGTDGSLHIDNVEIGTFINEIAQSPNPSSGATDIRLDPTLTWSAGGAAASHDVYLGTSFDDVNAATRLDPRDVLVSESQVDTTYATDKLAVDTTYYWRVDEVNSPPDSTIFKGNVWNFTTEPMAYEVTGVSATASSVNDGTMGAVNTVNGSGLGADGAHGTDLTSMWLTDASESFGWITFDLGAVYTLHRAHVWNHNSQTEMVLGYSMKDIVIDTSTDGETWTELTAMELPRGSGLPTYTGTEVTMDGAVAQYVRVTASSNWTAIPGIAQVGLSEIRFFYIPVLAREPIPTDGGTSDSVDVTLMWRPGRMAAQHEVLFSDDRQTVIDGSAVVDTTDVASLDVGTLDLGMQYFWKINEVNEAETPSAYEGDLWMFTTPEQIMIDDFEMYKAQEGLFIWEYWIDGFDDQASNGAVVGNGDDAETLVVYEGRQSMPIAFNNTLAPKSEATRFFDVPVDLTKGSPESLKLQVVGDPNNGAAPMYLILADTAGSETQIDHPDPAATVITAWDEWAIPLGDLSPVDVTKIDSITVGVGTSGVEGKIFVDAIRTHSPPAQSNYGLLAQYLFDEGTGTEVADTSGKGQDGAFVGEPVWLPGKIGTALHFDGIDDYVEIPHDSALNVDSEVTLALWINPERYVSEGEGWGGIMAKGGPRLYSLFTTAGGEIHFSTAEVGTVSSQTFPLNEWSHVAAQVVNGGHAYYINGEPAGTAGSGIDLGGVVNTAPVTIGNINETNRFYQGMIDEVNIFGRALSAAEVAELAK